MLNDEKTNQINNLALHIINLLETDDARYTFCWSVGHATEIFDKKTGKNYIIRIDESKDQLE